MTPICIFVYKRFNTTRQMLESLLRCPECAECELHVFMDAARSTDESDAVEKVRALFRDLEGFKSVHLHAADKNKGMARSVIEGVTYVMANNDSVIVLEDDLVVSSDFLTFMNDALQTYKERNDIWSISGYTPELQELESHDGQGVFLVPRAQCWGWATWRDRWETVDWEVSDYDVIARDVELQTIFNRGGDDLFRTLKMERRGRIESWAVRWAYAAAMQDKWTVNPMHSKVKNIGMIESTSHSGWHDSRHNVALHGNSTVLDPDVQPDDELVQAFKRHHDLGIISRIGYFMRLHNLGYNFIKRFKCSS